MGSDEGNIREATHLNRNSLQNIPYD